MVNIDRFILSANLAFLDYDINHEIPFILERPFFIIERALVNIEHRDMNFWVYDDEVLFFVWKIEKQPMKLPVVSMIDVVDEEMNLGWPHLWIQLDDIWTLCCNVKLGVGWEETHHYQEFFPYPFNFNC